MKRFSLCLVALLAASAAGACAKSGSESKDNSAELEKLSKRIDKLEASQKSFAEVDKFVRPIMAQQQAQQAEQEASEPDPTARFAVDITGNQIDGPTSAAVTIIEAWDFA